MIEFATIKDKKELSGLWQMTFLEDPQVIEDFFCNVFESVTTPAIKLDGEIVSSLFFLPGKIGEYEGRCVYCAMTKYAHRGKGYMKQLLDFSYDYCKDNDLNFLFLVPAEVSLFDYYEKCGFEKFGISRTYTFDGTTPENREKLEFQYEINFDNSITNYWKTSCEIYGGEIADFGLVFDDDEIIIRNAKASFSEIPEKYRKANTKIQGDIDFGTEYSPAMIKTENKELLNIDCYIGITLE